VLYAGTVTRANHMEVIELPMKKLWWMKQQCTWPNPLFPSRWHMMILKLWLF